MKACRQYSVSRWLYALLFIFGAWYGASVDYSTALAEGGSVLKGSILNVEGKAVEGAGVFVYDSPDVRRPANFISARTAKDGMFRMLLPPGRYWVVARLKKTEGYGPLMPGDKHSGEPGEIELSPDGEVNMDFIVADLREAVKIKTRSREGTVTISGKIIDENGSPVRKAYAIANRNEKISGVPDYLSAWVDDSGHFMLYIPKGKYYIGSAVVFPPAEDYFISGEMTIEGDKPDMDIVRKSHDSK